MFASSFARRVVSSIPRGARKMSGCPEEAKVEMGNWVKYSYGMLAFTTIVTVYNVMVHDHDHPRTDMPFMKIRNKPFPWRECPNCELLNGECWKKCRAEAAGEEYTEPEH